MIIKSVIIYVKAENIKEFIEATIENQNSSLKEKGIIGFDFFQCKDDSTKFLLHEVYKTQEDINDHMETEHFNKWISTVEKWFSSPREKSTYIPVS